MKTNWKAIVIAVAVLGSGGILTACGGGESAATVDSAIEISVWGPEYSQNYPAGKQTDPVMAEIESTLGISLNVETHPTEEKFNVLLASGSLPDMVMTKKLYASRMIEGETVIPLDSYLEESGKDIKQNAPDSIAFSKKYLSNATDQLYFLPTAIDPGVANPIVGMFFRWDYYKELGCPEITSDEEFIDVVAQMYQNHPVNEDGEAYIPFSPWFDWDIWAYTMYPSFMEAKAFSVNGLYQCDRATGEMSSMLEDDGIIWRGAKFWNMVNRRGLLDQDALTQKYETAIQKGSTNRVLAAQAIWQNRDSNQLLAQGGASDKGYASVPIPMAGSKYMFKSPNEIGSLDRMWAVTKNAKNPQKCAELLNYLFSYDGANTIINGIEGKNYTTDENGKRKYTQEHLENTKSNANWVSETGVTKYQNWCGISPNFVMTDINESVYIQNIEETKKNMSDVDRALCEFYNAELPSDIVPKNSAIIEDQTVVPFALIPETPDDIKRIDDKILNYLKSNLTQLVFAESDAEFTQIQQQIVNDVKAMDYDTSYNFYYTEYQKALEQSKLF